MASTDEESVRELVARINDAWLKGRPEDIPSALDGCFHEQMTIKGPDFQTIGSGKEACIRSYSDFLQQASVRECTLSEPDVEVVGDTAIASYSWKMTYELSGQEYRESGHDLFVFTRDQGRWLAVWRALLPAAVS
jgi:hypothetical protein